MSNNMKCFFSRFKLALLSALCFLGACSSSLPPIPVTQIQQESHSILDRMIAKCEKNDWISGVFNNTSSCQIKENKKVNLCENTLGRTPFDGQGYKIFQQVLDQRYPVTYQTHYRAIRSYNSRGVYTSDYLLGNGRYFLQVERSFSFGQKSVFCDFAKVHVTYDLKQTHAEIAIPIADGSKGSFPLVRSTQFNIKELEGTSHNEKVRSSDGSFSLSYYLDDRIKDLELEAKYHQKKYNEKVNRNNAIYAKRAAKRQKNQDRLSRELASELASMGNSYNHNANIKNYSSSPVSTRSKSPKTPESKKEMPYYTCEAYYDYFVHTSERYIPTPHIMKFWGSSPQHAASRWLKDCRDREQIGDRKNCSVSIKTCKKI